MVLEGVLFHALILRGLELHQSADGLQEKCFPILLRIVPSNGIVAAMETAAANGSDRSENLPRGSTLYSLCRSRFASVQVVAFRSDSVTGS